MVNLTINGLAVQAEEGATILETCRNFGIRIPTLCHLKIPEFGLNNDVSACRVCMVEIEGMRNLQPSCSTKVSEGMTVRTNSARAINARRTVIELMLSNHPKECLTCARNNSCELQSLAVELGVRDIPYQGKIVDHASDFSSYSIVRNPDKCILCRRCETICNEVQSVGAYSAVSRGFETVIGTAFNLPVNRTNCTFCGQCAAVCPTSALTEVDDTRKVWAELQNPEKFVVVNTAPAVRVALGEEFGMEPGTRVTGKMVTALKLLGFDKVMDTNFAADMTIMEEGTELVQRLQKGEKLPIITSCCPAWIRFIEFEFPDLLHLPSTARSPHEMFGAAAKTFLAEKLEIDPANVVVVSIMPCTAKKTEAKRPELTTNGLPSVDYVLTTREVARMFRTAGIQFAQLPDSEFDSPMGESTGAAAIFGVTGGVMEAALRTAYTILTNEKLEKVEFEDVRGLQGIKEATVTIQNQELKIAVANGLRNARRLMDEVRAGTSPYQAIEIMACPGGCVDGGGQPYHHGDFSIIQRRAAGLYAEDEAKVLRCSHENPDIIRFYEEFMEGGPCGPKAHELLHTHFEAKSIL